MMMGREYAMNNSAGIQCPYIFPIMSNVDASSRTSEEMRRSGQDWLQDFKGHVAGGTE